MDRWGKPWRNKKEFQFQCREFTNSRTHLIEHKKITRLAGMMRGLCHLIQLFDVGRLVLYCVIPCVLELVNDTIPLNRHLMLLSSRIRRAWALEIK